MQSSKVNVAEKLCDWNNGMVEYREKGLKKRKAGEVAFPGFVLVSFHPGIPSFQCSIIPPAG